VWHKKAQIKEKKDTDADRGMDPRVKNFAFTGLAIVMFSVFYKYNFNINLVGYEISRIFDKIKTGQFTIWQADKKKDGKTQEIGLIDIKYFKLPKRSTADKDLAVEGIFFDPDTKSFAIINGEVVSEGKNLGNITVKKINKDSVEIIVDGETKILEANQNIPQPKRKK